MSDSEGDDDVRLISGGKIGADNDVELEELDPEETTTKDKKEKEKKDEKDDPKKLSKKRKPALSEVDIIGSNGLLRLSRDFSEKLKPCIKGQEKAWLKHLLYLYKEWGFRLCPTLSFEDLAAKVEVLGAKEIVRGHLVVLREDERDRNVRQKFGDEAVKGVRVLSDAAKAAKLAKKNRQLTWEQFNQGRYDTSDDEAEAGDGTNTTSTTAVPETSGTSGQMADDVLQRIEENRRKALERLHARRAAAAVDTQTATSSEQSIEAQTTPTQPSRDKNTEEEMEDPALEAMEQERQQQQKSRYEDEDMFDADEEAELMALDAAENRVVKNKGVSHAREQPAPESMETEESSLEEMVVASEPRVTRSFARENAETMPQDDLFDEQETQMEEVKSGDVGVDTTQLDSLGEEESMEYNTLEEVSTDSITHKYVETMTQEDNDEETQMGGEGLGAGVDTTQLDSLREESIEDSTLADTSAPTRDCEETITQDLSEQETQMVEEQIETGEEVRIDTTQLDSLGAETMDYSTHMDTGVLGSEVVHTQVDTQPDTQLDTELDTQDPYAGQDAGETYAQPDDDGGVDQAEFEETWVED